jgi:hypothetical protein
MSAEHNMSPYRSEYITDYRTILGTCVAEGVTLAALNPQKMTVKFSAYVNVL